MLKKRASRRISPELRQRRLVSTEVKREEIGVLRIVEREASADGDVIVGNASVSAVVLRLSDEVQIGGSENADEGVLETADAGSRAAIDGVPMYRFELGEPVAAGKLQIQTCLVD